MSALEHETYCLPRPDLTEPRIESYWIDRTDENGYVVGRVLCTRCQDCGAAFYEGAIPTTAKVD